MAEMIVRETKLDLLPVHLPEGPRDLNALANELQPFVTLYHALLERSDRETALVITRQAIIESGIVSHSADAALGIVTYEPEGIKPLNLTSPPPAGFQISAAELAQRFDVAMAHFSCEGELMVYSSELVRFKVNGCNWCKAMEQAGTPELIPVICETDERFMDHHPTHRLRRPTAIGLGDSCCDFQFVPKDSTPR